MIIKDKYTQKTVYFPKNEINFAETNTLVLYSELTNKQYEFKVADKSQYINYFVFDIDFSQLKDGEYVYTIDGAAKGLVIIGEPTYNPKTNKNNNTIKCYGEK